MRGIYPCAVSKRRLTPAGEAWRGLTSSSTSYTSERSRRKHFAAAAERLPYVAQLRVTAVELMPGAAFAGSRNWGYDSVDLFAPARCYGAPDDLRRLVDAAHRLELAASSTCSTSISDRRELPISIQPIPFFR